MNYDIDAIEANLDKYVPMDLMIGHLIATIRRQEAELAEQGAEIEKFKSQAVERAKRSFNEWYKSPAFKTFVDLKYGVVGKVLFALQEGEITRVRAAECLAEIAHGATEVSIPEYRGVFAEDENPADVVAELRKDKERLCAAHFSTT